MSEPEDCPDPQFERRARELLQESVTRIDARVRSRLSQTRQAALAQGAGLGGSPWRRRVVIPVGLATAAAVTLVAILTWHQRTTQSLSGYEMDVDLLTDGEALELLEDDGVFYEWAMAEETGS